MKSITLFFSVLIFNSLFSQVPKLQKASDYAQDKIDRDDIPEIPFQPLKYVNPFVGTGGHGHTFPGPVLPFGMMQVGPDTRQGNWDACGGYYYEDTLIYGFSHTHLSGVGVEDYADLLLVPQQGKLKLDPLYKTKNGYGSTFKHTNEAAEPGFYSVKLDNGIQVKLSATERCAIHSYTFAKTVKGKKYILIDLSYRDKVLDFEVNKLSSNSINGKRISAAWANQQHFYFHLESSIEFKSAKVKTNSKTGRKVMVLEFPATTEEVLIRVGMSGTDVQGAKTNFDAEIKNKAFNEVLVSARNKWLNELKKIKVYSKDETVLKNFYTALYHTEIHPSLWSDVDGRYRTFDNKIATSEQAQYTVFSLWDTYRATHPLYTITNPQLIPTFTSTFLNQQRVTGRMPMWPLANNETFCMIGYHSSSVIADALAKGISLDNQEELLNALVASAKYNELGKAEYGMFGFISAGNEAESVSKTLEYAYDDWCIARLAESLGKKEVQTEFDQRASSWMNIFNPESRFFQARKQGIWLKNFVPNEINQHFTEANAWQYSLAVPHDLNNLIQLKGGQKSFDTFLDSLFRSSSKMSGREQSDVTGLIGQYAHGNEPSHHMAYLYNYAGTPWKTQEVLDEIMHKYYQPSPDGLSGNEDCGQMSAWYVFSAIGFYPVCPGNPTYAIGRPMVNSAEINLNGKQFILQVRNNSDENKYVQQIKWNNKAYTNLFITHEMLQSGGLLEIFMGPTPNKDLANYKTDVTEMNSTSFVPVPYFETKSEVFSDQATVSIQALPKETGAIYYSFDGNKFEPYDGKSIVLNESKVLFAKVVREQNGVKIESKTISNSFKKYEKNKTVTLDCLWENHYPGSGMQNLVDEQRGGSDFRNIEWQGFQCEAVSGVVEFTEIKTIQKVSLSSLQDVRSWIYIPTELEIEYSLDGKTYKKFGTVKSDKDPRKFASCISELTVESVPTEVKYIRFKAKNLGVNPDWHLSPGGKTWIFLDELIIE